MTKNEVIELKKLDKRVKKDFRGKWVAREGFELIAVADTLKEALRIAREKGVDKPIVRQVPREKHRYSFF